MANAKKRGNCYFCGKELGKTAMKNHLIKEHLNMDNTGDLTHLIRVEGKYNKNYWLFLSVLADSDLEVVDNFLRKIWLECCYHLSAFMDNDRTEIQMDTKIDQAFELSDKIYHLYDFGSTTELIITNMGSYYAERQEDSVELLARNIPYKFICDECDKDAVNFSSGYYSGGDDVFLCEDCYEEYDSQDEDFFMAVTNSPRMGVCGYDGGMDIYEFDPDKVKNK